MLKNLKKKIACGTAAVLTTFGLATVAVPAQAVGPSGIQICNSAGSETEIRPYNYSPTGSNYGWLYKGQCVDGYNGDGALRVQLSFFTKSYKRYANGGWGACHNTHDNGGGYTYNPPNSANGERVTIRTWNTRNCG